MKNLSRLLYRVCLTALLATSCIRQELEERNLSLAYIPVSMDWSSSLMPDGYMANVSIGFYPTDGSTPTIVISDDLEFKVVELPVGEYSVMIHNDIVGNVGGLSFPDYDSYDSASVHIIEQESSGIIYYYPTDSEHVATLHDRAASWSLDYFEVTDEMVSYTRTEEFSEVITLARSSTYSRNASRTASKAAGDTDTDQSGESSKSSGSDDWSFYDDDPATRSITRSLEELADVVPQPLTLPLAITIVVENLNNATYIEGVLRGTAHGMTIAGGESFTSSDSDNLYCWTFSDFSYDDSTYINGSIHYSLNTMGRTYEEAEEYTMELIFALQSGEVTTFSRDITQAILDAVDISGSIDTEIEITLDLDDELISLPEALEAGFGVSDWGESEDIYI